MRDQSIKYEDIPEEIPLQPIDELNSTVSSANMRHGENLEEEREYLNCEDSLNGSNIGPSDEEEDLTSLDDYIFDNSAKAKWIRFWYLLWNGPAEPRDDPPPQINVLLKFEEFPSKISRRYSKKLRVAALICYLLLWFTLCYNILIPYFTHIPSSNNDSHTPVVSLSCSSSSLFWRGKNGACGLNGELCPSISDQEQDVIFRCPALCDRGSWVFSLVPIGDQRIKYRGYFVGGGDQVKNKIEDDQLSNPYRADSFPCGAGVHAGQISPFFGGCARVSYRSKDQTSFDSTKGHYGVSDSISFNSFFPSSYFFKSLAGKDQNEHFSHCYDPRIIILILNIVLGLPIVYFGSGAVIFWTINIIGFWTICLATDPPVSVDALDPETYSNLISIGLERFLPSCFILYVLWHSSVKRTFDYKDDEKQSPLTKIILWYPLFWLGVLNNITFDRLPVDRLTMHDLKEQPGALLAVGSIISTILICAFIQAYKIWLSGRFKKYLSIYLSFILGLVLISNLPGLTLRIHHYILAMLLIPGCSTRGRTAIAFQGILLGLFLSGSSRWGLAAIAETARSLARDDPTGKVLPPTFTGFNTETGELTWLNSLSGAKSPIDEKLSAKYSEISLLINDIERYVSDKVQSVNLNSLIESTEALNSMIKSSLQSNLRDHDGNIPMYVRIGKKIPGSHIYSDFTNAAILKWPSGEFTPPKPGVT